MGRRWKALVAVVAVALVLSLLAMRFLAPEATHPIPFNKQIWDQKRIVKSNDNTPRARMATAILKVLPVGSTKEQVESMLGRPDWTPDKAQLNELELEQIPAHIRSNLIWGYCLADVQAIRFGSQFYELKYLLFGFDKEGKVVFATDFYTL